MGRLDIRRITEIPEELDRIMFVEAALGRQFMLCHKLQTGETFVIAEEEQTTKRMENAIHGLKASGHRAELEIHGGILYLVAFEPKMKRGTMDSLYRLFSGLDATLLANFVPAEPEEVESAKFKTEEMLSGLEKGMTKSASTRMDAGSETSSKHIDLYYGSGERNFLTEILEMLNSAMLANGNVYKVSVCLCGNYKPVYDYLRSRFLMLEERPLKAEGLEAAYFTAAHTEALPFDFSYAASMLGFSDKTKANKMIATRRTSSEGRIVLGVQLHGSAAEGSELARIEAESLTLGTLISGVPGTGKTMAAMNILHQVSSAEGSRMAIISPTSEWNAFGKANGLEVARLCGSDAGFNFFKCDADISIEKFYENLAMLLASASDAGPYTGSLEKCLLSAFRKIYGNCRDPDPVQVYEEVEEIIIEQHAKRTSTGAKYTKHGENIRASLENLRSMLNRTEFSRREGVNFHSLMQRGVVFDLSRVSNKMKPFFYALIMNQLYSISDELDTRGGRSLRMLLCLEEAQMVFRSADYSAATLDLMQRIQDFRKKGVGMMLVTHNVTDIEPAIRRLCQTKLYFRQSADLAKYAAADLIFGEEQKDVLTDRLRSLEQRVCALTFIQVRDGERLQEDSIFVKVKQHTLDEAFEKETEKQEDRKKEMRIRLTNEKGEAREGAKVQLFYLGEKIFVGITDGRGEAVVEKTISGNSYKLVLVGEKKKDSRTFPVIGGGLNIIKT